ncbi:GNAT family N-acetyltransferase [Candidatus Woesearchaeota archaeon]|nr:GNAT family N-acetyltransferase [Candidatus Woesearchaeota archaeon]
MTKLSIRKIESPPDKRVYERIRVLLSELYPKNAPIAFDRYKEVIQLDQSQVYTAFIDDKIVGMASIVCYDKLGGKVCVIEDVIVDKASRGQGVGKALTLKLLEVAQDFGAAFIDVNTRRAEAKEFYKRIGFQEKDKERPFFSLRYYL